MRLSARGRGVGVVVAALLLCLPALARAADFTYGQLYWKLNPSFVSADSVQYFVGVEAGFRRSAFVPLPVPGAVVANAVTLTMGSGSLTAPVDLTVQTVNAAEDWFVGTATVTFTVPTAMLPTTLSMDGCCRDGTLTDGNAGRPYHLAVAIPASSGPESPRSTAVPRIYLEQNVPASFALPLVGAATFQLATPAQSGLAVASPPGLALNALGTVTWTPTAVGLYAMQVQMLDAAGFPTPVDLQLKVLPPDPGAVAFAPGTCGQSHPLTVGRETTFSITASTAAPGETVAIVNTPLPDGAELLPITSGNTTTKQFRWTPPHQVSLGLSQGGALQGGHQLCFLAQTSNRQSVGQCCVTLTFTSADLLPLSGVLRRFPAGGASAGFGVPDGDAAVRIVRDTITPGGVPTYDPAGALSTIPSASAFADWWADGPNSQTTHGTMYLSKGAGDPVFRFEDRNFRPLEGFATGVDSFTYEAHTAISYEPGATLSFASADDLWVFLNGKLVVDLGGVHSRKQLVVTLDALAAQLGLVPGGDYPVDIFYAHRGLHPAVLEVELLGGRQCTLPAATPINNSTLTMMNAAHLVGSTVQLSSPDDQVGPDAAWTPAVPVKRGLQVEFEYLVTGTNPVHDGANLSLAQGLALVIAAQPGLGGDGAALGYGGLDHSVAVELDSSKDPANNDPLVTGDHIAVQTRGAAPNSPVHLDEGWWTTSTRGTCYLSGGDCSPVNVKATSRIVRVHYDVVAGSPIGWLRVWQDELASQAVPSLEVPIPLADWNATFPDGTAHVGFTTSAFSIPYVENSVNKTEYAPADVQIRNWKVGALPSGGPDTCGTACADDGNPCTEDALVGGTCVHAPGNTGAPCRPSSCANGTETAAAFCSGGQSCPPLLTAPCGQFVCGASSCLRSCTSINDCIATAFCDTGTCLPDAVPPVVTFQGLPAFTDQATLQLSGLAQDNGQLASLTFFVNLARVGGSLQPGAGGVVTLPPATLVAGHNRVELFAIDRAGNAAGAVGDVVLDTSPPEVAIDVEDGATLGPLPGDLLQATLTVTALSATTITGSASATVPRGGGLAAVTLPLLPGINVFDFDVTDELGRTVHLTRTVDYDTAALSDSATLDVCQFPLCANETVELNGGLAATGGVQLTFPTVTVAGEISVVETGSGCPPPTGFEVVRDTATSGGSGLFWNIDTTASFTGKPQVCIAYDAAWLVSQGLSEDHIKLVHGDSTPATGCSLSGAGWKNITIGAGACKSNHCRAGTGPGTAQPCTSCPDAATICGITDSFSPFSIFAEVDRVPPPFSGVPASIVAYATSTAGAKVSYTPPTATDALDGPRPVNCLPASGSTFPPGQNTVTCTATDTSGNKGTATFTVWVQYQAPTNGAFFLTPLRPDGSAAFRIGRPVPVRFKLTGASAGITNLVAKLKVTKLSNAVQGTADETSDETVDDTDYTFKYKAALRLYAYRWRTSDQTQGTYELRADLGDGVVHKVNVSLKKAK
jgi:fibro-slime domain-containing protein